MTDKPPVTKPVDIPFWSLRDGMVARECLRCGHRGVFLIAETLPFQVSSSVLCMACGAITFDLVIEDPTPKSVEGIMEEGIKEALDAE